MTETQNTGGYVVNVNSLPSNFPTHLHSDEFWTSLGRVVASYGYLEETLARAIFVLTGIKEVPETEAQEEVQRWIADLEKTLSDPLGPLIDRFGRAVRENPNSTISNLDTLLDNLHRAAQLRNVLCHGSWRAPDENGCSLPFFMNKRSELFQTPVNVEFIKNAQQHAVELSCAVINTVTSMGWQFPGSSGPGKSLY